MRWFGAVLAAGFDAIVNERANRMRWPRGPRRYDWRSCWSCSGCGPGATGCASTARTSRRGAGRDREHPSYGGGMRICPDADPADGLLDVVVAAPIGRVALARLKPRLPAAPT